MSWLPPLFSELPEVFTQYYDAEAPWGLLDALDEVLARLAGGSREGEVSESAHLVGDVIVVGRGTRIHPTAVIEGPVFIGRDAKVLPGAYIRGGSWIGDGCVVGAHTEIKHAILMPGAKVPHLNYVGDSILGANINLGAGTILSNTRHDRGNIPIRGAGQVVDTKRRKLGAILGDAVMTGSNTVLHPGVVVGCGTQIYPGVQLRPGVYPAHSIVKLRQELDIVPRALA
jgi:NDP-sugar pyrophosphorylase family protein